jgi:type I restriction enzyme M protein
VWFYEHEVPEGQKSYSKTKPIKLEYLNPIRNWWGGESRLDRKETDLAWKVSADALVTNNYNFDIKNPSSRNNNVRELHEIDTELKKTDAALSESIDALKSHLESLLRLN